MRILVVDDDKSLVRALKRGLEAEGFAVDVALDGQDGLWRATETAYDAIILDVMLPAINGYALCAQLRERGNWAPILMLTAKDGELDEAEALDTGADDFLSKPFSYVVLLARLRALLRRGRKERPVILHAGDLKLDPAAHRTWRGETPIELTPRQFALLEFFLRRPGEVLSKAEILGHVWDFAFDGAPTSWRYTSANCGSASTHRLPGTPCKRCVLPGTGSTQRADDMRTRITILATIIAAIALAGAGTGLIFAMQRSLVSSRDDAAHTRADDLAALARANALPATLPVSGNDDFAFVVDASGNVIAASTRVARNPPRLTHQPSGRTLSLPVDGESIDFRVWSAVAGDKTVYVGSSLDAVEEAVSTVEQALLIGLPVLLVLLAAGTWFVVGRALRPVEAIRSQVADISSKDLHRRVPETGASDEISRLAHTMNEMLARLQHASERERRFAADAAHELQTPLAAFRTHLEVSLAHPDEGQWQQTAAELLHGSQHMEQLVRDLLFLSRNETAPAAAKVWVDFDDIVLTEAARMRAVTRIRIDTSKVSAAPVRGSRDELTRLVRNLLENAERHATTVVTVHLTSGPGKARLVVADDGPGVPATEHERIFNRFARVDDGRSRTTGGTGLGLSIVKDIAERHSGSVRLQPPEVGAVFVVELTTD